MHRRQFLRAGLGAGIAIVAGHAAVPGSAILPASAQSGDEQRVVSVDRLNLRSGPGFGSSVGRVLSRGTIVSVISDVTWADGYSWVRVAVWGTSLNGWVATRYIGRGSGGPGGGSYPPGSTVRVAADPLNLRSAPGLGHGVVRAYRRGTSATVQGNAVLRDGYTWVPVRVSDGANGWFAAQYLTSGG